MVSTSGTGPLLKAVLILFGPERPLLSGRPDISTQVSRGMERSSAVFVIGSTCRILMVSLRCPPTSDAVPNDCAAWPVLPARESDPMISTLNGVMASLVGAAQAEQASLVTCPKSERT